VRGPAERRAGGDQPPRRARRARRRGDHAGGQGAEAGQVGERGERRPLEAGVVGPAAGDEHQQEQTRDDAQQQRQDDGDGDRGQRRRAQRRRRDDALHDRLVPPADGAVAVGVQPVVAPADGGLTCDDGRAEQDGAPRGDPGGDRQQDGDGAHREGRLQVRRAGQGDPAPHRAGASRGVGHLHTHRLLSRAS
jgi:hypothetical protein